MLTKCCLHATLFISDNTLSFMKIDLNKHLIDLSYLTKLEINQVIPNYKELCILLNMPILGGAAKKAQLKVWEQQIKFKRDKYKYIVEDVYPEVIPTVTRITKDTQDRMILLLCATLSRVKEEHEDISFSWKDATYNTNDNIYKAIFTLKEIFTRIGICGDVFIDSQKLVDTNKHFKSDPSLRRIYKESIFGDIPYWEFTDFYAEINNRGRSIVTNVIKTVNSSYLATIDKVYIIAKQDKNNFIPTRKADEKEYQAIRAVISEVLNRDNYKVKKNNKFQTATEKDIFLQKKTKEFYKEVCEHEWFKQQNILNFHTAYEITFTGTLFSRLSKYCDINYIRESIKKNLEGSKDYSIQVTINNINKVTLGMETNAYKINIATSKEYIVNREFLGDIFYNNKDELFSYKDYLAKVDTYTLTYAAKLQEVVEPKNFMEFLAQAGG